MTPVFVDTGAWYALNVPRDVDHPAAVDWFRRNTRPLITTDYVVDELLTLLRSRGEFARALEVGPVLLESVICDLEWVLPSDVADAWQVFSDYRDKAWSFTDCVSRVVMRRLEITTAFAFDEHFRQYRDGRGRPLIPPKTGHPAAEGVHSDPHPVYNRVSRPNSSGPPDRS